MHTKALMQVVSMDEQPRFLNRFTEVAGRKLLYFLYKNIADSMNHSTAIINVIMVTIFVLKVQRVDVWIQANALFTVICIGNWQWRFCASLLI